MQRKTRLGGIGLSAVALMAACGTGGGSAGGAGGEADAGPVGGSGGAGGEVVGGSGGEITGGSGGSGGEITGGAGGSGGSGGAVVGGSGGSGGTGGEVVGGSGGTGGSGGEVVGGSGGAGGAGGEVVGGAGGEAGGAGGAGGQGGEGPPEPVGVCEGNALPIYDADLTGSAAEQDFWTTSGGLISEATETGSCGGLGAETLLQFTAPQAGYWFFTTGQSGFDSVLYLRSVCDDTSTELACQDDATPSVYQSGVGADLALGQTVFLYVDAYSALVGTPWALRVFRNDLSLSPEVGGEAYILPEGGLGLSVATNDANGDAVETLVAFLDAAGEPLDVLGGGATEFAISPPQSLLGLRSDVTRLRLLSEDFGFDFGAVAAVTVRTRDLAGHDVGPLPIPLLPQAIVDESGACDPAQVASRCAEGLTCAAAPGATEGVCEVAVAPTLTAVNAWYSPDGNYVVVGLQGEDANADVLTARVELLATDTGEAADLTGFGEYVGGLAVLTGALAGAEAFEVQGMVTAGFGAVYLPQVAVPVDRVRLRLVDGAGLESAPLEANIGEPIVRIVGEACDPNGYVDGCIEGAVCRDAVCVEGTAPVITSAAAFRNPENALAVSVGFMDEIDDVTEVRVSLLTADSDQPIVLDLDGNTVWTGPGFHAVGPDGMMSLTEFVGPDGAHFGPPGDLSLYPDAVRASITLFDASGRSSETINVQIQPMIVVGENEYCDYARTTGCADGLVCADLPDFSGSTCVTRIAPVLNTLRVVDNRVGGRFGIDVEGVDPDDDIQYVQINLFDGDPDAGGVPVPIPAWGGETALVFFDITESDGVNFHGQLFLESHDPASPVYVAPFTHGRVALVDAEGLLSDPLTVVVETAPPVQAGEPCDVLMAFDYCVDGLTCDFDTRVCGP